MSLGSLRKCGLALAVVLLSAAGPAHAASVDTNPMNCDPQVRAAFKDFYNLDYTGAVEIFEHYRAEHPGDPQATAYLLDALVFQELYHQDLLDTTFYPNDGLVRGRHATEEDPKKRDQIFALADEAVREADLAVEPESQRCERSVCARLGAQLAMHLCGHGGAGVWHGIPPGDEGQGRCLARAGAGPELCGREADHGGLRVRGRRAAVALQVDDWLCRNHGIKATGLAMLRDDGERGVLTSVDARTAIALFSAPRGEV